MNFLLLFKKIWQTIRDQRKQRQDQRQKRLDQRVLRHTYTADVRVMATLKFSRVVNKFYKNHLGC